MEFFNKKEEVLDIQLTAYGRYLLSLGKFRPALYAFFDDDILYDTEAAGRAEKQNDAQRRIQYNTPTPKVQPYVLGAETRVNQFQAKVTSTWLFGWPAQNSVDYTDSFNLTPQFEQKFFHSREPLGTSDLKSPYAPGWEVLLLTNNISSSQPQIAVDLGPPNGTSVVTPITNGIIKDIPQIDIQIDYKTFFSPGDANFNQANLIPLTPELNADGIKLYVEDDYLVVEVQENNTDNLKENFDVEVFYSSSVGNPPNQYTFIPEQELFITPEAKRDVEYYINVLMDGEMPPEVAQDLGIDINVIRGTRARLSLSRDLYDSGVATPEEGCE